MPDANWSASDARGGALRFAIQLQCDDFRHNFGMTP
jgi:hypothetical protein